MFGHLRVCTCVSLIVRVCYMCVSLCVGVCKGSSVIGAYTWLSARGHMCLLCVCIYVCECARKLVLYMCGCMLVCQP